MTIKDISEKEGIEIATNISFEDPNAIIKIEYFYPEDCFALDFKDIIDEFRGKQYTIIKISHEELNSIITTLTTFRELLTKEIK